MPPPSPWPGWARGDVWSESRATRRGDIGRPILPTSRSAAALGAGLDGRNRRDVRVRRCIRGRRRDAAHRLVPLDQGLLLAVVEVVGPLDRGHDVGLVVGLA